jgi:hypothetical protein
MNLNKICDVCGSDDDVIWVDYDCVGPANNIAEVDDLPDGEYLCCGCRQEMDIA